jgi:hypothetical protein
MSAQTDMRKIPRFARQSMFGASMQRFAEQAAFGASMQRWIAWQIPDLVRLGEMWSRCAMALAQGRPGSQTRAGSSVAGRMPMVTQLAQMGQPFRVATQ